MIGWLRKRAVLRRLGWENATSPPIDPADIPRIEKRYGPLHMRRLLIPPTYCRGDMGAVEMEEYIRRRLEAAS